MRVDQVDYIENSGTYSIKGPDPLLLPNSTFLEIYYFLIKGKKTGENNFKNFLYIYYISLKCSLHKPP